MKENNASFVTFRCLPSTPLNGVNMNQYFFFFQTPNLFKYIKKKYVKYFHLRYVIAFIFVFCIFQKMIPYQKMRV